MTDKHTDLIIIIITVLICIAGIIAVLIMYSTGFTSYAAEVPLIKAHATAYCLDGMTASGTAVRKGICASGHRDWLGKTCILYQRLPDGRVGDMIGIYEIEDTGCKETVIDVWCPEDECQDFMDKVYEDGCGGHVWIQLIEADG